MVNCRLPSCQTLTDRSLTLALSPLLQRRLSQSLSASPSSSISFSSSLPIIDPVVTSQAVGAVNTLKRVQVHQCTHPVFFFGLFWVDGYPDPPTQKEPPDKTHCMPSFRLIRPCTSQPQPLQSLFALSLVSHTNVHGRTFLSPCHKSCFRLSAWYSTLTMAQPSCATTNGHKGASSSLPCLPHSLMRRASCALLTSVQHQYLQLTSATISFRSKILPHCSAMLPRKSSASIGGTSG